MNGRLDLDNVSIGEEVAIECGGRSATSYVFCTVHRIGKQFVEVREVTTKETRKFSKVTGKPLGADSWHDRDRLYSAEFARKDLDAIAAQRAYEKEAQGIRSKLDAMSHNRIWDLNTVKELHELADRMQTHLTSKTG